ncbi:MAG TPA: carboxypeptidase [Flavobacteriales bacterium]|nr:carboxypeptidase [Flavobacteriales bacterium]|tara:strand:+ start:23418 stop:24911 length:1494 start_codon:yes stop_codon:yes gene_type:complete
MPEKYSLYKAKMQQLADISHAASVLNWDQEVYMPSKGAQFRAQQLSTLAGLHHQFFASDELGEILNELNQDDSLTFEQKRNVQLTLKDYTDNKKYTTEFVQKMSKTVSEAFIAWQEAKQKADFTIFAPKLKELVKLKREECEILGYTNHPYDALLDQYEPGITVAELDEIFEGVKEQLVPFVKEIFAAPQNDESVMFQHYDKDKQWQFSLDLLKDMGYDFDAGRQDISTHPFTTSFSPQDVRVTTRVNENDLSEIIWSTIHEGGHALYEQGLLPEYYGLPQGSACSLGIHESQSRLWENNVGRSLAYWQYQFEKLKKYFPEQLKNYTEEDFYKAMNIVKPSLIRTNADEVTYHFHILIRYEIEKELIAGNFEVDELPALWNKKYRDYLGIDVPSDDKGVLQDIHWSHGSFGYFPTYSIGSFYAAQFFQQANKEIEGLENMIQKGDTSKLLEWLREKIHKHGRIFEANQLCEKVTGEKLNFSYFMDYAQKKYRSLYNL